MVAGFFLGMEVVGDLLTGYPYWVVWVCGVFAGLTVVIPVITHRSQNDKVKEALADLKKWLIGNNTAVTVTLLVVFAVLLADSGLKILFAS